MKTQAEQIVEKELQNLEQYAKLKGFEIVKIDSLTFVAKNLVARDGEKYALHVHCEDYPVSPPIFRWCDPETFAFEAPKDTPEGSGGYFHGSGTPCTPWNRNSYKQFRASAPHGDWDPTGWQNNPQTGKCTKLGMMFAKMCTELKSERYRKRKARP